jgi:hypothetical protein
MPGAVAGGTMLARERLAEGHGNDGKVWPERKLVR